jgi:hypothetical protein
VVVVLLLIMMMMMMTTKSEIIYLNTCNYVLERAKLAASMYFTSSGGPWFQLNSVFI